MTKVVDVSFRQIFCTLQVEGLHNWESCDIDEVMYLKLPHRHVFHIKAIKTVYHNDRDIEFIKLKHSIQKHFREKYFSDKIACCDFKGMSCEMIAEELGTLFSLDVVEISEDNENGCILYFEGK